MPETFPQLLMEKDNLDSLPEIPVPPEHILRAYRSGDEQDLARLYDLAQLGMQTAADVQRVMLDHPCFTPNRLFVVEYAGHPVGTAASWREPEDPDAGYLHMVSVAPDHRGRKLGAILCTAAARYSHDEGFRIQRLKTDDWRDPAIRLYFALGFYPVFAHPSHPERWAIIAERLSLPGLLGAARTAILHI